jgi:threonine synthase
VFDPHGAVACAAARRWRAARPGDVPVVVLATAHPAKFADTIAPEVGFVPALPAHEQDWPSRRLLAIDLADTTTDTFREFLLGLERR